MPCEGACVRRRMYQELRCLRRGAAYDQELACSSRGSDVRAGTAEPAGQESRLRAQKLGARSRAPRPCVYIEYNCVCPEKNKCLRTACSCGAGLRIVFGSLGPRRGSGRAPAKPGPTGAGLRVANSMPRSPGQFFRAEVNRDALQKQCLERETVAQRGNTHSIRKFRAPEGLRKGSGRICPAGVLHPVSPLIISDFAVIVGRTK